MPFQRLSEIPPSSVSWLVPFWLPRGKLVILDGNPGMGKSLITLDLCARVTTGRSFFADGPDSEPANVVLLNAEDSGADIVLPRLKALGADLDRVYIFNQGENADLPRIPSQIQLLDDILRRTQAQLLAIDPIVAFLDRSIQTNNDMSVRQALQPLGLLSQERGCGTVLNRHLNKTVRSEALYRGGGSIGFQGACRVSWLAAADPVEPGRRVLAQVKNNLAPLQPSLGYRLESQDQQIPVLHWLGRAPFVADQLTASKGLFGKTEFAKDFLLSFLEAGPRTYQEIKQATQAHNLALRTVALAKEELGIVSERGCVAGKSISYWCLDGQVSPLHKEEKNLPDVEEWLRPFREQFPPDHPLDEAG